VRRSTSEAPSAPPPAGKTNPLPDDKMTQRRARLYPATTSLHLSSLRRGQVRGLRLRLMEMRGQEKLPTDHYLDLKICCDVPDRVYYIDAKADLAGRPPGSARLSLLKSRHDTTAPVELVERGCCAEKGIALEIRPETTKVVLWLATEGSPDVPSRLAAVLNVRPPTVSPPGPPAEPLEAPPEELDTMRLPSIKSIVLGVLAKALRSAPSDSLSTLGTLFESPGPAAMAHLGRLIDFGADIRIVEAAVRSLDTAELSGTAPGRFDFVTLDLNTPAGAAVAVFHPRTPAYLLNQAFLLAFENNVRMPQAEPYGTFWRQLAKAAAVLLVRFHHDLLTEDVEVLSCSDDPFRPRVVQMMIEWASRKQRPFTPPPAEPIDNVSARIAGADPDVSLLAAVGLLATYGFIGVSAQLD
jgi:hypothetical protein